MNKDYHELPRVDDSVSYLYLERCRIEQDDSAIAYWDYEGRVPIPIANLCALLLGPGTVITHAAVHAVVENGCNIVWVGEQGVRTYASATGETRHAKNLLRQAYLATREELRLRVVARMYRHRFPEDLPPDLTLQQIRGREGARMKNTYAQAAEKYNVPWDNRQYNRQDWNDSDDINRALSCATSCLYGLCHAIIVSLGYSPGLGFIHTGKQLSFVYDIADLYKAEISIPVAFQCVATDSVPQLRRTNQRTMPTLDQRVRYAMRAEMQRAKLLERVPKDLSWVLGTKADQKNVDLYANDPARPHQLWEPSTGSQTVLPIEELHREVGDGS